MSTLVLADMPLEEVIINAKEIGIDTIEVCGKEPHLSLNKTFEEVKNIKKKCDDIGIDICSISSYLSYSFKLSLEEEEKELKKIKRFSKFCNILDCKLLRVGTGGSPSYKASKSDYQKAAEWMKKACDIAADYEIKLVTEIHNGCLVDSAENAIKMADLVNRPNYGFTHDAGNMYISDVNYGEESVYTLGEKLFHVHVKDELRVSDDTLPGSFHSETKYGDEIFQHRLLGTGAVNHISLFKALLETKYSGYLSLEIHGQDNGIESLEHDYITMKSQLIEICV